MKDPEIYWYENQYETIIGVRGGLEYRMNRNEFMRLYLRHETLLHSKGKKVDVMKEVLRLMMIESEYIDFEIVQPDIKLLNSHA